MRGPKRPGVVDLDKLPVVPEGEGPVVPPPGGPPAGE